MSVSWGVAAFCYPGCRDSLYRVFENAVVVVNEPIDFRCRITECTRQKRSHGSAGHAQIGTESGIRRRIAAMCYAGSCQSVDSVLKQMSVVVLEEVDFGPRKALRSR